MLPDPLPTDPDELETLYRAYLESGHCQQTELDRLMEARLRAWGYDPAHMTADQVIRLMEEAVNHMVLNLHGAMQQAPDAESAQQMQAIAQQAEDLRQQIYKVLTDQSSHI